MRMPSKAHSQLAISRAKTITVRTGSMQRCLFPTGKGDSKGTSCFFTRMISLVLQERKCPQEHAPLEAPHSCKVTVFSSTDYYINLIIMKYHKSGFLLYFSYYMGLFNKTNLSTALFNFSSGKR